MMTEKAFQIESLKQEIRRQAEGNRRAQPDKEEASRIICEKFAAMPEYVAAQTVMCYVHFGCEVRTGRFLRAALDAGKRVVVPYCLGNRLELFVLESMDELAPGKYGIPEPKAELRALADRGVDVARLDLVMVPGVAFDRHGARLGRGQGYYDRLLAGVRPDTRLVAPAFECQMFQEIPTQPHDVCMDQVVTEKAIYRGRGRQVGPLSDA